MSIQICIWLCFIALVQSLEVGVPERFLRPRNFNPHPYTEELQVYNDDIQIQDINSLPHPYQFFERPPTRGDTSSSAPIQFPKVPEAAQVQPKQPQQTQRLKPPTVHHPLHINDVQYEEVPQRLSLQRSHYQQIQPIQYQDDQLQNLGIPIQYKPSYRSKITPKNYAFSYAVKDGHNGDDFSHSQAHSNAQTKGEYRVKLPDGRTQVVSYTADDHGYRADVRYDEQNSVETPSFVSYKSEPLIKYKPVYKTSTYKATDYKPLYHLQHYRPKPDYTPIHEEPVEPPQPTTPKPLLVSSQAPQIYNGGSSHYFAQSTQEPYIEKYYSTPAPEYYVSSTQSPQYYPSSTVPSKYNPSAKHYYLIQH